MVMRRLAVACGALAALGSCNTGFAPQYLVRDLRVLAAHAEVVTDPRWADADAGESVRLTALVANPQGSTDVTVRWKGCLPRQGEGVSPCLDPAVLRDPSLLDGLPGTVDLGTGESVVVRIPPELQPLLQAVIDRAEARPELACTLYLELPVLAIASSAATTRMAVKTVRLTPWREVLGTPLEGVYVRNQNPAIAEVIADPADADACTGGAPLVRPCSSDADCGLGVGCRPGPDASGGTGGICDDPIAAGTHPLCVKAAADSVQIYRQCSADGSRTDFFEGLSYQWYATAGTLKRSGGNPPGDTGNVTGDTVDLDAPAGPFTLWVIVRDDRGGEGWLRRDVVR
jgi:hypothetical protein